MPAKPLDNTTPVTPDSTTTTGQEAKTMTISRKKLAIEGALTPYLSDDHLLRAIRIWEERYSQQPTFALQRFINEFCDNATLMAQRSQILQSLIRALSGTDGRPRDKPMLPTDTAASAAATIHDETDGSVESFSHLIEDVFSRVPGDMHVRIRLFMLENLPGMKLSTLTQRALHAWLSQQYRIPGDISVDAPVLSHLINLCYISLCEFLGPVKADKLLHEAVLATESRCTFPIHRLL